ncbi:MAG TPA: hypothetical protein VG939_14330, partial [Caulobacteraceae bacterium]|nr:hypothetical protein [Caulobacteraceae bacterium]
MAAMTALPDPSDDLAPSRDPADYGRRRMFSNAFWAMMVLCLLCVLGGVAVVVLAPRLLHKPAATAPTAPPAAAAPVRPVAAAVPL